MKAANTCGAANFFLIATLLVFFMLLYVYAAKAYPNEIYMTSKPVERFNASASINDNTLANPDKIVVFQGSTLPDKMPTSINWDQYSLLPSVDGTSSGPKAMSMFAYNKCSPSCCNKGSPYTCSSGCVCMTDNQFNFLGTRGHNNKRQECTSSFQEI